MTLPMPTIWFGADSQNVFQAADPRYAIDSRQSVALSRQVRISVNAGHWVTHEAVLRKYL
jgi:hypothetical protein